MESTKTGGNIIKLLYTKDEREHRMPKWRRKRRTLTMKMTTINHEVEEKEMREENVERKERRRRKKKSAVC